MSTKMVNKFYAQFFDSLLPSKKQAYRYYDESRSYADLNQIMRKVNFFLYKMQNRTVIIYSDKSPEAYATIFACILSGNIWVPMSLALPSERNNKIIDIVVPAIVFIDVDLPGEILSNLESKNVEIVDLRTLVDLEDEKILERRTFKPNDIAYIMFTSGSTGTPKGVPMTHANYINFINNCVDILGFRQGDVFADYHDFAFDISVFYVFCFPIAGGIIAPVKTPQDRILPLQFMQKNKITIWSSVPSVAGRIQQIHEKVETSIRVMFLCGEPFALSILKYCQQGMNIPHVYNFYGLTETGVENFYHYCESGDVKKFEPYGYVPIGRPLPGNQVDVSDEGELLLTGCQITPGYLGEIGKDQFFERDNQIWYHTGDLVDVKDGYYFCKGRMDSQIKLRGYRIELMDVEVNLSRHRSVSDVVCFVSEVAGRTILVAVIVPKDGNVINPLQIKNDLATIIPNYMMPHRFFQTDQFPTNSNGKKDRNAVRRAFIKKLITH